ncbi:hypothetical protein [Endozoicomonas sp.]|uniref:hypothetical protein n=1 Tax=Endozoicomonas sp. TaxID=1892382 RepID=UPI003AF769E5
MSFSAPKYLKHEMLVCGTSNTLLNMLIAWLLLKDGNPISWKGENNFVGDMIATSFLLSFIISLILISVNQRKLIKGKVGEIDFGPGSRLQQWVNRLPSGKLGNAFCFGLLGLLIAVPLPLAGFAILGVEQFAPVDYAVFKGFWAGALSTLIVVPIVMSALRPRSQNYSMIKLAD